MDHPGVPRHRAPVPAHRVLAVLGAAAVTALAAGGALGLVPGVALGETPAQRHLDSSDAGGSAPAPGDPADTGESGPDPADTESTGATGDGEQETDVADGAGGDEPPRVLAAEPPPGSGSGMRVVYDISAQQVWLMAGDGSVERSYLVSGARRASVLPPGTYAVTSKSRHAVAYDYRETMDFMVRFAHGEQAAIGFHDIPRDLEGALVQTRAELGTPRSAGCIRQARPDAVALWRFTEIGTPVVVVA